MKYEKKYILLVISLVMLIVILSISIGIRPRKLNIGQINKDMKGHEIIVSGKIKNIREYENNLFFVLFDKNSSIKCVQFRTSKIFRNNERVAVWGKVEMYKNEPEIIVNKIYKI